MFHIGIKIIVSPTKYIHMYHCVNLVFQKVQIMCFYLYILTSTTKSKIFKISNLSLGPRGGSARRRMFTMNLHKRGNTVEELERIDGYLKHHCPVAHGYQIGGMYTDLILDTAPVGRLVHLQQLFERHGLVHPEGTVARDFPKA